MVFQHTCKFVLFEEQPGHAVKLMFSTRFDFTVLLYMKSKDISKRLATYCAHLIDSNRYATFTLPIITNSDLLAFNFNVVSVIQWKILWRRSLS